VSKPCETWYAERLGLDNAGSANTVTGTRGLGIWVPEVGSTDFKRRGITRGYVVDLCRVLGRRAHVLCIA
jgi:hypothetical protein